VQSQSQSLLSNYSPPHQHTPGAVEQMSDIVSATKKNCGGGTTLTQVKDEDCSRSDDIMSQASGLDDHICDVESEYEVTVFREKLPLFGWVPLVFYLPSHAPQQVKDLITQNGGQISPIVECFTYQISLISSTPNSQESKARPNPKHYHPGKIYSIDWLRHSVEEGRLLTPDPYCLLKIDYVPSPHQRTRFTMRELIKIF
jgi:hypothetical protein